MKKKFLSLVLVVLMVFTCGQAIAAEISINSPKTQTEKRQALGKRKTKIKNNSKFNVVADYDTVFAATLSSEVTDVNEINLLRREAMGLSAQATQTSNGDVMRSNMYGYLEQYFSETVEDTLALGVDEEIYVDGSGFSYWCGDLNQPLDKRKIVKFTGVQDSFTFGYQTVSNTSSVGHSASVSPSSAQVGGSVSSSWTTGNATSTYTIAWPEVSNTCWYDKTYGTIFLSTKNINSYSHNSSAIAVIGASGYAVQCNAYSSLIIN